MADNKRQFNVLLPESLIRAIKIESINRGMSLSTLVEAAMRAYLATPADEGTTR
ncbi:MAG TPA: CopG family transcriptional regulator [Pseudonocardiaceae bacterium]|nr:CopG family transcriptional regulator [Pseudonocardiaceae bacterium]